MNKVWLGHLDQVPIHLLFHPGPKGKWPQLASIPCGNFFCVIDISAP